MIDHDGMAAEQHKPGSCGLCRSLTENMQLRTAGKPNVKHRRSKHYKNKCSLRPAMFSLHFM